MIIIGIVGSRRRNTEQDKKLVEEELLKLIFVLKEIKLCSGGCKTGADRFCEEFSIKYNVPITVHKADWKKNGRGAGFVRNTDIAKDSDVLIACVAEDRKGGTEDTIKKFKKFHPDGKVVLVE